MLIYIDPSLMEYFKSVSPSESDLEALENIISSHKKGYHYVSSNRKTLDFLSKLEGISSNVRKQLDILFEDYSTLSSVNKNVSTKIVVLPPNGEFQRYNHIINSEVLGGYQYMSTIFEVPLRDFLVSEVLDKTRFITENLNDSYFYEFIGNNFAKNKYLPSKISIDHVPGGGLNTPGILEDKIVSKHIVFSLVDSDKKEPTATLGVTGKEVLKVFEKFQEHAIIGFDILPVHEIENLLSSTIYENFSKRDCEVSKTQLKILETHDRDFCFLPYIDMKEGLHTGNFSTYFEGVFDISNLIPQTDSEKRGYKNEFVGSKEAFLNYLSNPKGKLYLIKPVGPSPFGNLKIEKLKENINEDIARANGKASREYILKLTNKIKVFDDLPSYLLDFQRDYLEILGMQIKEWGLANPKSVI
ncbi:hypothetical protein [Lysinibacillus xylanilyticus]|uniref:Uncharacterized protein n=1 Tax=Lysinibacillus xylanilyticus TaxID=582475 RepID=A0ABV3VQB6_9BACI